ncbi:hypothetical protein B0H17DRAFT_1151247 [Mycena rosella]|uniref:Uncharacterized protein n=1 Tax=Mycena rosella TaxID=1033263 RepID=A0AAD7BMB7_MYCRO|nr:hypothetical protein B0H17DRAFT_1151247 [Mycena rosella]
MVSFRTLLSSVAAVAVAGVSTLLSNSTSLLSKCQITYTNKGAEGYGLVGATVATVDNGIESDAGLNDGGTANHEFEEKGPPGLGITGKTASYIFHWYFTTHPHITCTAKPIEKRGIHRLKRSETT